MLEEAGLETTLAWYLPTVERQTGIALSYEKSGEAFPLSSAAWETMILKVDAGG